MGRKCFISCKTEDFDYKEKLQKMNIDMVDKSLNTANNKALPSFLELLKLTYIEKFDDDRFNSFQSSILNALQNISLISESDFHHVINQLNKFINKNKHVKHVNFLFHTIQRIEEKFYTNRVNSYTIEEVKQKLKLAI